MVEKVTLTNLVTGEVFSCPVTHMIFCGFKELQPRLVWDAFCNPHSLEEMKQWEEEERKATIRPAIIKGDLIYPCVIIPSPGIDVPAGSVIFASQKETPGRQRPGVPVIGLDNPNGI